MGKVLQLRSQALTGAVSRADAARYEDEPLRLRTVTAFAIIGVGLILTAMMPAALAYVAIEIFGPR